LPRYPFKRVAVLAKLFFFSLPSQGKNAEDALAAGANRAGGDELVADILKGTLDFDRCFATPDMMPVVAKVARVLGPRGLMPTTKNGTVTENIAQSVQNAKFAKEFRSDKAGIVHGGIGKENFDNESLEANIRAFVQGIKNSRGPGKSSTCCFFTKKKNNNNFFFSSPPPPKKKTSLSSTASSPRAWGRASSLTSRPFFK